MDSKHYKLAVIGGGASGLAAAITAAEKGIKVVVLEGGERVGRKLAASGNGQGNIANAEISPEKYNCPLPLQVFKKVPYGDVEKFFTSAGIETVQRERGRIYPLSLQASSVVDNLRLKAAELGVAEVCGFKVLKTEKKEDIFFITSEKGTVVTSNAVIAACGGVAHPNLSCGDGYRLLTGFGHKLTKLLPSLVQLKTVKTPCLRHLKGIRLENVNVKALSGNSIIKQARGDVIFTDCGISGNAVFEISGAVVKAIDGGCRVCVNTDTLPDIDTEKLKNILTERKQNIAKRAAGNFLTGFVPKQLAGAVYERAEINVNLPISGLTAEDIGKISFILKNFEIEVTGSLSFNYAQVTMGGIDVSNFDENLMSRFCENLYACGEMLDVDGDCGGYNLLWAFSSGILCGREAAKKLRGT
jgi:predicted Rossmann fold flavoprotein